MFQIILERDVTKKTWLRYYRSQMASNNTLVFWRPAFSSTLQAARTTTGYAGNIDALQIRCLAYRSTARYAKTLPCRFTTFILIIISIRDDCNYSVAHRRSGHLLSVAAAAVRHSEYRPIYKTLRQLQQLLPASVRYVASSWVAGWDCW